MNCPEVTLPRRAAAALALLAALLAATPVRAEGVGLYIYKLGEQAFPAAGLGDDTPVTAELEVRNSGQTASALLRYSTVKLLEQGGDELLVLSRPGDRIKLAPTAAHSRASFVIDFDEPPVAALAERMSASSAGRPTPLEMQQFVYDFISDKSYARNQGVASQIAQSAAGDCTEHATLLTALARAHGYPSRVVFGVLMLQTGETVNAFGHAWTEIHDGEQWLVLDATLPGQGEDVWMRYLPFMPMTNEGPGFLMGMVALTNVWPAKVRLADAAEAD